MLCMVTLFLIAALTAGRVIPQSNSPAILNDHATMQLGFDSDISLFMRGMKTSLSHEATKSIRHPNITLVSWLASEWSDDGFVAMRNNRRAYAESQGYEFLDFNETNLPTLELRQNWRSLKKYIKPRLLLELMKTQKSDWIVWTDADTMYTNAKIPWTQFLEPEADLVFAEASDVISNDGVFAVRTTSWSKSFLQDWLHECDINAQKKTVLSDNGPFVHSLLRAYAKSHNVQYNDECRQFVPTFDGLDKKMAQCYRTHLRRISNASAIHISPDPAGSEGFSLVNDAHIRGVWGINSGLTFKQPCKWKPGDFLLHLAGQGKIERRKNALQYSKVTSLYGSTYQLH